MDKIVRWSLIYNIPPPSVLIFISVFFCFFNAGEGLLLILKLKKSYKLISHYNYPVFFTGVDWDRHCPFTLLMMLLDTSRATQALPAFLVLLLLNFKGILPGDHFHNALFVKCRLVLLTFCFLSSVGPTGNIQKLLENVFCVSSLPTSSPLFFFIKWKLKSSHSGKANSCSCAEAQCLLKTFQWAQGHRCSYRSFLPPLAWGTDQKVKSKPSWERH